MVDMEDGARRELLGMDDEAMGKVADVVNRFPAIDLTFNVAHATPLVGGERVQVQVKGFTRARPLYFTCVPSLTRRPQL